jgi:hypothetical protein
MKWKNFIWLHFDIFYISSVSMVFVSYTIVFNKSDRSYFIR